MQFCDERIEKREIFYGKENKCNWKLVRYCCVREGKEEELLSCQPIAGGGVVEERL